MEHDRNQAEEGAIADLLRLSTPQPDPGFVWRLEETLLPASRSRPGWRLKLAPAVPVLATAAVLLGLGLAGSGPLSVTDNETQATDDCRYVRVEQNRRVPVVTTDAEGRRSIVLRERHITRLVRRCR